MATPVAHVLAGCAVGSALTPVRERIDGPLLGVFAAVAVAPDLDFLPGLLRGQPALYHQGVSHSLLAAALVAGFGALLLHLRGRTGPWVAVSLFGAYASHILVDLFGPDGRAPYGMPIFWPVSADPFLAPVVLFRGVQHADATSATTAEWIAAVFAPTNLAAIGLELLWLGPLAVFAAALRIRRRGSAVKG